MIAVKRDGCLRTLPGQPNVWLFTGKRPAKQPRRSRSQQQVATRCYNTKRARDQRSPCAETRMLTLDWRLHTTTAEFHEICNHPLLTTKGTR
jgi:hypothetical protein